MTWGFPLTLPSNNENHPKKFVRVNPKLDGTAFYEKQSGHIETISFEELIQKELIYLLERDD